MQDFSYKVYNIADRLRTKLKPNIAPQTVGVGNDNSCVHGPF